MDESTRSGYIGYRCSQESLLECARKNKLLIATTMGVFVGIVLGVLLRYIGVPSNYQVWLSIWGELFLRMLKLVVLPLVVACLITGISSMKGAASGKLGAVTLGYVYITQIVSVFIAAVCTVAINPGSRWTDLLNVNGTKNDTSVDATDVVNYNDVISDFIRNLFPDNFVKACLQNAYTDRQQVTLYENGVQKSEEITSIKYRDGTNMIGIIVFSTAVGFAVSYAGEEGKALLNVFKSLSRVVFMLMHVVVWYTPFAIVSLIASAIVKMTDVSAILSSVGLYIVTFIVISFLHQFVLLPLIYFTITRQNPLKYHFYLLEGILAGMGPANSIAALPLLMESCKTKLHIDPRLTDFVLPIETMTNRDGSAMFVVFAALYVAQTYNIAVGFGNVIVICLLAGLLAPTVPPIPSGSILLLVTVSSAVNIPLGDRLGIIMALEWLVDRIRTANNIASNGYGCGIIHKIWKKYIQSHDIEKEGEITCVNSFHDIKGSATDSANIML